MPVSQVFGLLCAARWLVVALLRQNDLLSHLGRITGVAIQSASKQTKNGPTIWFTTDWIRFFNGHNCPKVSSHDQINNTPPSCSFNKETKVPASKQIDENFFKKILKKWMKPLWANEHDTADNACVFLGGKYGAAGGSFINRRQWDKQRRTGNGG